MQTDWYDMTDCTESRLTDRQVDGEDVYIIIKERWIAYNIDLFVLSLLLTVERLDGRRVIQFPGNIDMVYSIHVYGWPSYSELIILTAVELFLPK